MATKIRGITVEIGGDASGLDKALQTINKSIINMIFQFLLENEKINLLL